MVVYKQQSHLFYTRQNYEGLTQDQKQTIIRFKVGALVHQIEVKSITHSRTTRPLAPD